MPTEARIGNIMAYRPTLLLGTPTYMIYLGETMKERGIKPQDISVGMILIGGEPGGSLIRTRKRLMSLWGCDVCDGFGTTEVGALADMPTHVIMRQKIRAETPICISQRTPEFLRY